MKKRLACFVAAASSLLVSATHARTGFDLLIRGGEIYSGDGHAPIRGSVGIKGDRIVYVGPDRPDLRGRRVIDARGMAVLPGLIDVHSHPDTYIRAASASARLNAPWLMQGVTTVFIGVDGYGTPDVGADSRALERKGIGTNIVPYVGFGAVRHRVLGDAARAPDAEELGRMKQLVAKGMCEGAVGFSTGLFYAPQSFAKTEEVIALAREAALRGGVYDTHQRDESSYTIGLLGSVREAIRIGREAGLPVHFAHLKALGVDVQGQAPSVIAEIEKARASGLQVTADQYPWLASGSDLEASLIPRWAVDGGIAAMRKRFEDPAALERIRIEARENLRRRGGAGSILLTSEGQPWSGKRLSEMAALWRVEPVDAAIRILSQSEHSAIASFNMREDDVEAIMKRPWVVTSSDGSDGHPRQFATFPELYRTYVVDRRVISFGAFVRRSTGASAEMFRLSDRGYLRPGYFADVLVLDRARYRPRATYVAPRQLSEGVRTLIVNGKVAVDGYRMTGVAAGRALLRTTPKDSCPA
ncbi:MAG: amidohydrolase family protein [Alphaproteobacteria bacterium]|nr:amidohydrolase family protein [Alphaproteobacteria bacterium]